MTHGFLAVVTGPMFSGKTSWLVQRLTGKNYKLLGLPRHNPLVHAHILDMGRYSDKAMLVSHDGLACPAEWFTNAMAGIWMASNSSLADALNGHDWWVLDEAQFVPRDVLFPICKKILAMGKNVCVAGLSQDSFGNPFGGMGDVLATADKIVVLRSKCKICGKIATKTQRMAKSTKVVHVGGASDYEPRCLEHWSDFPVDSHNQGD